MTTITNPNWNKKGQWNDALLQAPLITNDSLNRDADGKPVFDEAFKADIPGKTIEAN